MRRLTLPFLLAALVAAGPARAEGFSAVSARPLPPDTQVAHPHRSVRCLLCACTLALEQIA